MKAKREDIILYRGFVISRTCVYRLGAGRVGRYLQLREIDRIGLVKKIAYVPRPEYEFRALLKMVSFIDNTANYTYEPKN